MSRPTGNGVGTTAILADRATGDPSSRVRLTAIELPGERAGDPACRQALQRAAAAESDPDLRELLESRLRTA